MGPVKVAVPDIWAHISHSKDNSGKTAEEADGKTVDEGDATQIDPNSSKTPIEESTFMMVVGPLGSGKSTAISHFLNPSKPDNKPKPTVALEYTYGRRTSSTGDKKDICHIWELGGGSKLSNLIDIAITPSRLSKSVFVITADLSTPATAFSTTVQWLDRIRSIAKHVPCVVVGTKYDKFNTEDGLKRKALCQALRYVACLQGASLVFISHSDSTTMNHFRAILNHYAFGAEKKRSLQVDPMKPLVIPAKKDNIEKIGMPGKESAPKIVIAEWNRVLEEYWPTIAEGKNSNEDEEILDLLPETTIDTRRKHRQVELDTYRSQALRKAKFEVAK